MKIIKKPLSIFIALIMIFSAVPLYGVMTAAVTCGDFEYSVLSEDGKTCEITGYTGSATELDIPSELDGYTVTDIGWGAFIDCTSLISVIIPNSVKFIGYAFCDCTSLENISIPNSVTTIERGAFFDTAYYNTESNWENDVLYIGNHLIEAKSTLNGEYNIKEGTKTISNQAFCDCSSLTNINIPNSVTNIGHAAFRECNALTSITIPDSVTYIGVNTFSNCTSLISIDVDSKNTKFCSENGVLFNKGKTRLICYPAKKADREYTIPADVQYFDNWAFSYCDALTNVTIESGIEPIEDYNYTGRLFWCCNNLTKVQIGSSVKLIGNYFIDCSALTSIEVDDKNTEYTSVNGVLFNKDKTKLICYPRGKNDTRYTIPNSVTSIEKDAFRNCKLLTEIAIPNSVISLGDSAFINCYLEGVVVPDSVIEMTDCGFGAYESYNEYMGDSWIDNDFIIYGYTGSAAERYANENELIFIPLSNVTDNSTNISVSENAPGVIPENVQLNIITTEKSETKVTYHITLLKDDAEIQPESTVTVKIPVPATMNGEDCKVYRAEADSTYTDMNAIYRDSFMIFTTDHFSEYVLTVEKSEKTILKRYKDQIRFQKNDDGTYAGKFDYRTLAMISKGDFIDMFGSEENAVRMIKEIGFIYATTKNVPDFNINFAKSMVENGIEKDSGYVKVPVNYISTAFSDKDGQNADYVISCIITNVDDANDGIHSMAYIKYTDSNGDTQYVYYDTVEKSEFKTLFDKNFAIAFPEI